MFSQSLVSEIYWCHLLQVSEVPTHQLRCNDGNISDRCGQCQLLYTSDLRITIVALETLSSCLRSQPGKSKAATCSVILHRVQKYVGQPNLIMFAQIILEYDMSWRCSHTTHNWAVLKVEDVNPLEGTDEHLRRRGTGVEANECQWHCHHHLICVIDIHCLCNVNDFSYDVNDPIVKSSQPFI